MTENNDNIVGILREKTEEGDLDTMLKTSIGGYTKRSVMEYLAYVKKQQQNLKEAFAVEQERLQGEKAELLRQLEELNERVENGEEIYRQRLEAEKEKMREERAALEKDMDEAVARIKEDEQKLKRSGEALEAEKQKTEQVRQEVKTKCVQLDAANARAEELTGQLSAKAREVVNLKESERILRQAMAEDVSVELKDQVQTLMGNVEQLQSEIRLRNQELENRAGQIENLRKQEQSNHAAIDQLQNQLRSQSERNEWAENENNELSERLKAQVEESITLSRENSRLKAANAILQRRLEMEQAKNQIASVK